jgi:hypothetical protein
VHDGDREVASALETHQRKPAGFVIRRAFLYTLGMEGLPSLGIRLAGKLRSVRPLYDLVQEAQLTWALC